MPTPNPGEKDSDFLGRCMGEDRMRSEFPKNDQRYAVCQSKLRKHKEDSANRKGGK